MRFVGEHARERATYHGPPWPQPVAEVPVTEAEVADWRARHQATCAVKIARSLCALERDYTLGAATARSGGPTA